jgi:peptide/nickel transport system substrate-binding protein
MTTTYVREKGRKVSKHHKRRLSPMLAALFAFLLCSSIAATAASGSSADRAADSSSLHFAMPAGDIDHLDPGLWYYASTWKLSLATCTPLLTFPDAAGNAGKQVVGGIAGMPKISNGGRTYTFQIKPGLKFPNGQPITAAVEKATFDRLFGKKLASPAVSFFNVIAGSQAVADGKATSISGIKAQGNTLTMTLTSPVGSFLKRMTVPWTCPVPLGSPATPTENGSLLVSGPYVVSKYVPDRTLVLSRNPAYNATQLGARGHFQTITFDIGVDPSQAELQIKAGQLDGYLDRLPSASVNQDLTNPSLKGQIFVHPTPSVTYLWMNNDVPPFNNPKVRQAVNYAINRNAILRVWGGRSQGQITDQILPPTMGGYRDATIYPASGNVAKAKQLLKQAGVKLPVNTLLRTRSDSPGFLEMAQVVQSELKQIGFNVTIKSAPDSVNGGIISTRANKIPMGINNWTQDYPDGDDFFVPLLDGKTITPTNNNNYAAFSNVGVEKAIARISPMVGAARDAAWENLDISTMKTLAPWAPLINPAWVDLFSSRLTGYVYTPVYGLDLTTLRAK